MKRLFLFISFAFSFLIASPKLQEIEEQNKILEAQIKQEELRQRLKNVQSGKQNLDSHQDGFVDKNQGYVFGLGLGFAHSNLRNLESGYLQLDKNSSSYDSFVFDIQLGKFKKWNKYLGLMYYYNLDLIVDKHLNSSNQYAELSGVISASTFNADMIIDAVSNDTYSFGFLLGVGMGFDITHYNQKGKVATTSSGTVTLVDFDIRANIGIRAVFKENYSVIVNCSVPFLENSITGKPIFGSTNIIKNDVIFNLRFAYLLF